MNAFPWLDPIPLPAPVWLFKALHILTLSFHFVAMQMFLGGLLLAMVLSCCDVSNSLRRGAAAAVARRLPTLLTFVINFGVPPLLFAQVLYGPALYTSSLLIGAYWFAVIPLLMGCYWLVYKFADGAGKDPRAWWKGSLALVLATCISMIYSTTMTLMLRPEVWSSMYTLSASGIYLPTHDPTLMPRWLFMLTGGCWVAGLWMIWIAGRKSVEPGLGRYLATIGGRLATGMILVQAGLFYLVLEAQPAVVKDGIAASALLNGARTFWCAAAALVLVFALWVSWKRTCTYAAGYVAALLTVVTLASWVIVRDGIRDLTLASKGFDVWQQAVVTNWGVVGLFVATLALGLVAMGWLISVMMRATPVVEGELS